MVGHSGIMRQGRDLDPYFLTKTLIFFLFISSLLTSTSIFLITYYKQGPVDKPTNEEAILLAL